MVIIKTTIRIIILTFLTLLLFICTSCSDNVKNIVVEPFDYSNILTDNLIKTPNKLAKSDKEYHIINKKYKKINDEGYCSIFNKVDAKQDFYIETKQDRVLIFKKINGKCLIIHTFNDVMALSNTVIANEETLYLNMIFDNEETNKNSGLWLIKEDKVKHFSNFMAMSSHFNVDIENNDIYSIEQYDDEAYFRQYDKDGNMKNEYAMSEKYPYIRLYIKKNNIYLFDYQETQNYKYNYIIDEYNLDTVFKDIGKKVKNRIIINDVDSPFNTVRVNSKYITFHSPNTIICDLDYVKCLNYNNIGLVDESRNMLISKSDLENDNTLLYHKFGSKNAEKILSFDDSYLATFINNNLFIKAYDKQGEKFKIIKYIIQ